MLLFCPISAGVLFSAIILFRLKNDLSAEKAFRSQLSAVAPSGKIKQ